MMVRAKCPEQKLMSTPSNTRTNYQTHDQICFDNILNIFLEGMPFFSALHVIQHLTFNMHVI